MANLEPNVLLRQRPWRVIDNVFEALRRISICGPMPRWATTTYIQTLVEFLLLLVDYAEAKVDFIGLFKARLHVHDLRKGFLGVLEGAVAIVQDANAVPEFRLLRKENVRAKPIKCSDGNDLLLGLGGGIGPAGTPCRLLADCPS